MHFLAIFDALFCYRCILLQTNRTIFMERAHKQCTNLYFIFSFFLLNLCFSEVQAIHHSGKKAMELLVIHSFDSSLYEYPRFNNLMADDLNNEKIQDKNHKFYIY